jgi:hypothetical protein
VPFLRRILSGDYRRAVAAEAAGDYAEAARHYGLAGERDKVAEMHLLRAERATTPAEGEGELRDALRWADPGTPARARVARALGNALLRRARAEGTATARDQARVREAARLLEEAGELREAGGAFELLGDDDSAARAFEKGGYLDEMEAALHRDRDRRRAAARVQEAFHDYETALAAGARDRALDALRACIDAADDKGEYRRLLDALAARRLADGVVTLQRRGADHRLAVAGAGRVLIGRDPECALALRAPGVSRVHAAIAFADGFRLRDAGSKHGTWLAGLPLAANGEAALAGEGRIRLGTDCELAFRQEARRLRVEVARGLDRGAVLVVGPAGEPIALAPDVDAGATLHFDAGRPMLDGPALRLGGAPARGPAQLIRGDHVSVGGLELDVL